MFAPLAHLFLNSVIVAKVCAAELDSSSAPYTLQQVMCSLPLFFLFVCFLFLFVFGILLLLIVLIFFFQIYIAILEVLCSVSFVNFFLNSGLSRTYLSFKNYSYL